MIDSKAQKHFAKPKFLGRVERLESGTEEYIKILKKKIPHNFKIKNMKSIKQYLDVVKILGTKKKKHQSFLLY